MLTSISYVNFSICCSLLSYGVSAAFETNNAPIVQNVSSESVHLSLKGLMLPKSTGFKISLYKLPCKDLKLCKQSETRLDRFGDLIELKGLSPNTKYEVIVEIYTKAGLQPYTLRKEFKTKSTESPPTKASPTTSHLTRTSKAQTKAAATSTGFTSFPATPSTQGAAKHAAVTTQGAKALNGLIWWVVIVGGAGLGMIILLSILTVLFHMPWRRHKLIQLRSHTKKADENTYDKIEANGNSNKMKALQSKNDICERIMEKEYVDNERSQKTQSALSWGTEFDATDPIQDGAYANSDFLFT